MAKTLQFRRGTTSELSSVSGSVAELFVNTEKDTVVVMDGSTNGGFELTQNAATQTLTNKTLSGAVLTGTLTANSGVGTSGQVLKSTGSGVEWASITDNDTNTTYAVSAETTAGGVNLRLTGSDASTDDVKFAQGSNITLTRTDANTITIASADFATETYVNTAVSNLVDSAPATLDTLNELAAALGDDPNYATTITTALGNKQPTLVSGTNIKSVNSTTLLGSGNLDVQPTLVSGTNIKTINGTTLLGSGDITISLIRLFNESTISTAPSSEGNFDLSYEPTQTTQETPFTNGETDAFGVNLTVFKYDMMDPIGQTINIDLGAFA